MNEIQGLHELHHRHPDGEIDGEMVSTTEIAEDAQWFIDEYARESYCSMVEMTGEDE